jgi:dTMP kinase
MESAQQIEQGRFITFEGGEGAGKSVQARRLADRLRALGLSVTLTREPGGTPAAEAIRALLVTGEPGRWTPETEALLFAAARAEHLARLIRPARAAGAWVICDRFADSTRAYQGAGGAVPKSFIESLNRLVVGEDGPDLTLILDLPVEAGLARAEARAKAGSSDETRFERFDRPFHERLRDAYLKIAAAEPARCTLIDAARGMDEVAAQIWAVVQERFSL